MRSVFWDDAARMHACLAEHVEIMRKIQNVTYRKFTLTEPEFRQLVIMDINHSNSQYTGIVSQLMPKGRSREVGNVTSRLRKLLPAKRPIEVFRLATEQVGWFEQCFVLCARFDRRLMGELHVRPLFADEKSGQSADACYYLEDGAYRALTYAMLLDYEIEGYEPVSVTFSEDWSHIYPWGGTR